RRRRLLYSRPVEGHVHLGRRERLPGRDREPAVPDAGRGRGGGDRRARPEVGRGWAGGDRPRSRRVARRGVGAGLLPRTTGRLQGSAPCALRRCAAAHAGRQGREAGASATLRGHRVKRVVTQRDFDRFAALSRDDNPIHCDPGFARGTHFGATVAHGMFLYGLICGALTRRLAVPWLPVAQTLMFPAPTFAGDAVTVRVGARLAPHAFDVGVVVERDGRLADTAIGESVVMRAAQGTGGAGGPAAGDDSPDTLPLGTGPDTVPLVEQPAAELAEPAGSRPAPQASLFGIEPGQRAKATRRFEAGELDEYADLCGDANPLVVDT